MLLHNFLPCSHLACHLAVAFVIGFTHYSSKHVHHIISSIWGASYLILTLLHFASILLISFATFQLQFGRFLSAPLLSDHRSVGT